MSGRQNRSITGNNRGQNTNTRQYGSTEQQKQSYANAVQQNVRQPNRNQDRDLPRTDTDVTYIGQRFNNQRRDEPSNSFNPTQRRQEGRRGRNYGQNRPRPPQGEYTSYTNDDNRTRPRPYQRDINQNYFLDKEEEFMIET